MIRLHPPRILFGALLLLVAACMAYAQQVGSSAPGEKVSADEEQIRKAVIAFVELYNAHKAVESADLFAADARMVYRHGTEENGREEIKQSFEDAFKANPKIAVSVDVEPDGTSASATRRLTRVAQDRVIWTATDRILGNEQLSDLAVTMVRKPPQLQ